MTTDFMRWGACGTICQSGLASPKGKRTNLSEGILERSDGCEDFGQADQDVRSRHDPNINGCSKGILIGISTLRGFVVMARRQFEEVVL